MVNAEVVSAEVVNAEVVSAECARYYTGRSASASGQTMWLPVPVAEHRLIRTQEGR
ncbi:hypothetical protein [Actinomadura sp. 7K507]|uniref:hypothetical protein n=1 Tax=Actinomadura sp. 7K507 TaxID=2530365 RepID=UPI0014044784|nr:hypothetical protein [Actinomadura sp. 7K507]